MLLAFALALSVADWVPARWPSSDPLTLVLLDGSPVNCLLMKSPDRSFVEAAHARKLVVLSADPAADWADGFVLENDGRRPKTEKPVILLGERRAIRLDSEDPVIGTSQGVWPGIEIAHGKDTSRPTGGAWINTNTGVLRFLRSATNAAVWLAKYPPAQQIIPAVNYLQAVADSAAVGARWVVSLDPALFEKLRSKDAGALADWKRLNDHLRFYEEHKEWRSWPTWSQLALVQDVDSGALVTGNLLDMLAVMNTPVRAVPSRALTAMSLNEAKVAVTVNPGAYTAAQQAIIKRFSKAGGTIVKGPEGWTMPVPTGSEITFNKEQYRQLEAIWPELHTAVSRKNFAARLFNVTGTLSYLQFSPDGKRALLQLVNYTDYPVESITAFVQGKFKSATLHAPGRPARKLAIYDAPEGTGVEIDGIETAASVVLE